MPEKPTILQIIPKLDTGGAEVSTLEITEALTAAGARALIASEGGRMEADIAEAGGELLKLPLSSKNPLKMRTNAKRLAELVKAEHVNLMHARSRAPAWSALLASRQTQIPFITTYHGAHTENGPLKRLYNSVMTRGRLVIANSQFTARNIQDRYRMPLERVRIILRGVSPAFDPARISPERISAVRARWGLEPHEHAVLLAARLSPRKGQHVAIDAVSKLLSRQQFNNTVAVLAGDHQGRNDYKSELEAHIRRLNLEHVVRLTGHENDMPAAFAAARIALVTSTEPEAFGRTSAEAQAVGCPVIAVNIGGTPETLRAAPHFTDDQITGWLVEPEDSEALAAQLAHALHLSPAEHLAIGARARVHTREHFTSFGMKHQTLGVYDEILGTTLAAAFHKAVRGQ